MTPFNAIAVCPHCGVRFNGTTIDHGIGSGPSIGGGLGIPPTTPAPPPAVPPDTSGLSPQVGAGALPTNPAYNPAPLSSTPLDPPSTSASPPTFGESGAYPPSATAGGRGKTLRLIGLVVGVILLVGFLAALGVVVSNAATTKPIRRRPRRFDDDD
ncbi:hypothetical protein R5W23_000091 [Gemmata sp. JC673]|uniref:Uncharacterized protein n=1 Tax=Gemmata algarum TaxID=2975278 RepID=A0ABU5ESX1_9BACT|nr:hypothetical protein [Gemmata algarum]MDY3557565.1 hypothetical protein [Gemmata algarum]